MSSAVWLALGGAYIMEKIMSHTHELHLEISSLGFFGHCLIKPDLYT